MAELEIDAEQELRKVDEIISDVIADESTWKSFVTNPVGLLTTRLESDFTNELDEVSPSDHLNQVFEVFVSSEEVKSFMDDVQSRFKEESETHEDYLDRLVAGLREGKISHTVEYDAEFIRKIIDYPEFEEGVWICGNELLPRGLLHPSVSPDDLKEFSRNFVSVARNNPGMKLSDLPQLRSGDFGTPDFAAAVAVATAVVAVMAVAVVAAEVAVGATTQGAIGDDLIRYGDYFGGLTGPELEAYLNSSRFDGGAMFSATSLDGWSDPNSPDYSDLDAVSPFDRVERALRSMRDDGVQLEDDQASRTLARIHTLYSDLDLAARLFRS